MTHVNIGTASLDIDEKGTVKITSPHQNTVWPHTHKSTTCYVSITLHLERLDKAIILSVNTKHGIKCLLVAVPETDRETWLTTYQNPKYMFVPVITY